MSRYPVMDDMLVQAPFACGLCLLVGSTEPGGAMVADQALVQQLTSVLTRMDAIGQHVPSYYNQMVRMIFCTLPPAKRTSKHARAPRYSDSPLATTCIPSIFYSSTTIIYLLTDQCINSHRHVWDE